MAFFEGELIITSLPCNIPCNKKRKMNTNVGTTQLKHPVVRIHSVKSQPACELKKAIVDTYIEVSGKKYIHVE